MSDNSSNENTKSITLGRNSATGAVKVYRDDNMVTVVTRGEVVSNTPNGRVVTHVDATRQYESIAAYESDLERMRTSKRFALAFQKVVHALDIEEDARNAPPLPVELRHLLPEHMRALPSAAGNQPTKPNLFLLPRVGHAVGGGRR